MYGGLTEMRKFIVNVNGNSYEVEVEEVGGAPVSVTAAKPVQPVSAPAPVTAAQAAAPAASPAPAACTNLQLLHHLELKGADKDYSSYARYYSGYKSKCRR
jgi:biotin carboxyl carrier protein